MNAEYLSTAHGDERQIIPKYWEPVPKNWQPLAKDMMKAGSSNGGPPETPTQCKYIHVYSRITREFSIEHGVMYIM